MQTQLQPNGPEIQTIMPLRDIQFMHQCRDGTYYLEYSAAREKVLDRYRLRLKEDDKELRVQSHYENKTRTILIFASSIRSVSVIREDRIGLILKLHYPSPIREYSVPVASNGSLASPPSSANQLSAAPQGRPALEKKLTQLTPFHKHIAPFTWSVIRLVFERPKDLETVLKCNFISELPFKVERHSLSTHQLHFSREYSLRVNEWFARLPWGVAFQCAGLLYNLRLCTFGLLELQPRIEDLLQEEGPTYTEDVIRQLGSILQGSEDQQRYPTFKGYLQACLVKAHESTAKRKMYLPLDNNETGPTKCYHVNMVPIGFNLQTLFLDMSNRVLRTYPDRHDHFLRVSFTDEQGLPLRFKNQNINKVEFVRGHIRTIMEKGFSFLGRRFQYLHYSQSSLRELTFWYMYPFKRRREVNADTIRTSIGLEFPGQLTRYPARFGARLAQAFTATNSSIVIDRDEVELIPDVERPILNSDVPGDSDAQPKPYCFTDGVGCFSSEMGSAIHRALLLQQGKIHDIIPDSALLSVFPPPSVYQIRMGGAKGIIALNPLLTGRVIQLRPSMIKFEVPHHYLEIACSFDRPARVRLNRPLIAILYGRGVPKGVFLKLQCDAIIEVKKAASLQSLELTAGFLKMHTMGSSFGLSATLLNLHKLDMEHNTNPGLGEDNAIQTYLTYDFMERCMSVASYHMLRNLKYKMQIPVPQSWKLVGISDEYGILEPGQIFVSIVEDSEPIDVEGKVLILKSPVISLGDVQFATAVSRKSLPSDCPLLKLKNCVFFSQRGDRPLPNMLGGADLDGDMYDIVTFDKLYPERPYPPMHYEPTSTNRELEYDCRVNDVIDFVLDFVLKDTIGLISTNFLRIAEESGAGHPKCQKLAQLHSQAVDFPKTGLAVPRDEIPFPRKKDRPDFLKPELEVNGGRTNYYRSNHVLGELYRKVELPDLTPLFEDEQKISKDDTRRAFYERITECLEKELSLLTILSDSTSTDIDIPQLYNHFVSRMQYFQDSYMLGFGRYQGEQLKLSEEEILVGTILAKTFDFDRRNEDIQSLREETGQLARQIWRVLKMGDIGSTTQCSTLNEWINRAWAAWKFGLSDIQSSAFGWHTFMFVVLGSLFAAIKEGKQL